MIWNIAWKNIWRNKLRSLLVIVAIALGITAGAYTAALSYGMASQKIRTAIANEVSHIQVHHPSFLENYDYSCQVAHAGTLIGNIEKLQGVKKVCKRTVLTGMAVSATSSMGVRINAVDPGTEIQVTDIYRKIPDTAGSYFSADRKNQLVISRKMADKLKVRVRSKLILRFQDAGGNLVEGAFKVTGIYRTGNGMFDEFNLFIRRQDLELMTGTPAPVHEVAVLLESNSTLDENKSAIQRMAPGMSVLSWEELQPELSMLTGLLTASLYFILAIVLLALAFGIVNTMLMVVMERIRELGMLMAIGMNRSKIFRMIMAETVLLSLTGGIAGMLVTLGIVGLTARSGIDLSAFTEGLEALGYDAIIYPENRPDFYFGTIVLVILTGILSALYPARKALQINPADATRSE